MAAPQCHRGARGPGLGWGNFWLQFGTVGIQLICIGATTSPILSKNASRLQPWPPKAEAPSQNDQRLGNSIATIGVISVESVTVGVG